MKICNTTKFQNKIQVDVYAEDDIFMIEPKFSCTLDAGIKLLHKQRRSFHARACSRPVEVERHARTSK